MTHTSNGVGPVTAVSAWRGEGDSSSSPRSFVIRQRNGTEHTVLYDSEDALLVLGRRWKVSRCRSATTFYAVCSRTRESMHRLILGLTPGDGRNADHINLNGLDNRRANLRIATDEENMRNRPANRDSRSGFKGVWRQAQCIDRWQAEICVSGVRMHLGMFPTAVAAALAYNAAAIRLHGEFARLNEIRAIAAERARGGAG